MWLIIIALICLFCVLKFNGPHLDTPTLKVIEKMKDDSLHPESIKQFTDMSMTLIRYQNDAVYKGIDRTPEATQLSEQIQDRFQAYDFSYHQLYLKQIKEPKKYINRELKILDLQGLRLPLFYS
jgi:hypothetical protein